MKTSSRLLRNESAQAMVETAIVCPMVIFFMLGVIQLGMMQQARLMVEYAAFNAARAGSVWNMSQWHMHRAAEMSLVPTRPAFPALGSVAGSSTTGNVTGRIENFGNLGLSYAETVVANLLPMFGDKRVIHIDILNPTGTHFSDKEELDFDDPGLRHQTQLTIRLTYFYRMKIPFANWVIFNTWMEIRSRSHGMAASILSAINSIFGTKIPIENRPFLAFDAVNYTAFTHGLAAALSGLMGNGMSSDYEGLSPWNWALLITYAAAKEYYMPLITSHTIRMQSNPYKCVIDETCEMYGAGFGDRFEDAMTQAVTQ